MIILILCILLFVLTGIGCWALCAASDTDEYDDEEVLISRQPDGSYIIDGQTLLEDIEDAFDMHFDSEDIDTINGYLIYKMGKIPQDNEQFECTCDGYSFRVLEVHDRMVTKVGARREEERQQPVT